MPETNTLAHYENPKIIAVKSFTVQAPGPNPINYILLAIFVTQTLLEQRKKMLTIMKWSSLLKELANLQQKCFIGFTGP